MKIPQYKGSKKSYEADACLPLIQAVEDNHIRMEALVHGHYPGKKLPDQEVSEVCSVGYWDANTDQNWGLDWHRNEGIEITYLAKGYLDFCVEDKEYELYPGSLTITRPWQSHRVGIPNVNASHLYWIILDVGVRHPHSELKWPNWILFSKEDLEEFTRLIRGNENPVWNTNSVIGKCFEKIYGTVNSNTSRDVVMRLKIEVNELLFEVFQYLKGEVKEVDESLSSSLRTVELFLKDLSHSLNPNTSLDSMAEECGLARTQFSEYCHRLTNRSPLRYLNDVRLQIGKKCLLQNQEMKVSEISEACGFWSANYFSRFFRKETGYTPKEFQNKFGQGS